MIGAVDQDDLNGRVSLGLGYRQSSKTPTHNDNSWCRHLRSSSIQFAEVQALFRSETIPAARKLLISLPFCVRPEQSAWVPNGMTSEISPKSVKLVFVSPQASLMASELRIRRVKPFILKWHSS